MEDIVIQDRRVSSGYRKPVAEVHGTVDGFVPAGDFILVRRNKTVQQEGMIVRPEIAQELAERGVVIAVSQKASDIPVGLMAKFSKYGAEEIHFDDEGEDRYALVRSPDVRGWHRA